MTTGLIRWSPETDLLRGRLDRVFNQMLNDLWRPSDEVAGGAFVPAVDVQETPEALNFTIEVPGLTKDDVHLTLENQVLTISGERKRTDEKKGETWHRVERSYGSFSRSFTLPGNVQAERATAKYDNGILTVTVPKAETPKPHTIKIS